nr:uncharacterized protein CI109_003123 [Kwoniella shandongensis]KAA5528591.1 hypothetical protein CI109_003123 [Kwoniella shandongensis]
MSTNAVPSLSQLATTTQALGLLQHLYTPNILILVSRILAQIQITASGIIHPTRSLLALSSMLTAMNAVAMFLHVLDFAGGMNGGKGLVLDFVGQANPASLTRILLLDLALYILQLTSLCISYINNHTSNLPTSSVFPYDDLLLPPDLPTPAGRTPTTILDDDNDEDDGDVDLEDGRGPKRRRRKGKGAAYEQVDGDERELWLDDDVDDGLQSGPSNFSSSSVNPRVSEPPLILSLSLRHILNLIFYLPAPAGPPRAFSGGTPLAGTPQTSPPITPPTAPHATMPSIPEEGDGVVDSREVLRRASLAAAAAAAATNSRGDDHPTSTGRIPGEYRSGDGG